MWSIKHKSLQSSTQHCYNTFYTSTDRSNVLQSSSHGYSWGGGLGRRQGWSHGRLVLLGGVRFWRGRWCVCCCASTCNSQLHVWSCRKLSQHAASIRISMRPYDFNVSNKEKPTWSSQALFSLSCACCLFFSSCSFRTAARALAWAWETHAHDTRTFIKHQFHDQKGYAVCPLPLYKQGTLPWQQNWAPCLPNTLTHPHPSKTASTDAVLS